MRMRCYGCSPKHVVPFVPVDTTMPFKTFQSVVAAYRNADYRQIAKDVKFASWAELVATKSEVLRAWIRSQGFACSENSRRHAVLVERADSIRMWLKDPQLFERPAKAHAPGDLYYRNRGTERVHKPRRHVGYIEQETVQSREDLGKLSTHELKAFVRPRVLGGLPQNKIELLSLAQEAWNKPKTVRSNIITPEELQYSADLDRLSKDGLRTWIQSRGWTRSTDRMKRVGLLDLARRILGNPDIVHSTPLMSNKVQSREDLKRLSKHSLATWIHSRGYGVTSRRSASKEEVLDQACAVWDYLESVPHVREARANGPTAKQKQLNFATKEIKNIKTRSDLTSMKKDELFDWIRSQGIVIPRDFRATEKKPVILELAENIWDYVKDGKSLPGNVQIRTAPKTRLDLSLMFRKDVVLWIRSHDIPIRKGVGHTWEELRSLAEQIWDANQNDTLDNLRPERKPDYVKVPQTRKDLGQMRGTDLTQWIGSQGVGVGRVWNKKAILALAEKTWDAVETGTPNNLKKRKRAPLNKVKVPEVREDLRQMTVKNLGSWMRSQGIVIPRFKRPKEKGECCGFSREDLGCYPKRHPGRPEDGLYSAAGAIEDQSRLRLYRPEELLQQTDAFGPDLI